MYRKALSLLLFLCFINDLPNNVLSKIKLYSDDVLLYATIHTGQDCNQLQMDLDTIGKWADRWKMVFNPQKCEFLGKTNKKHKILAHCNIQNKPIKEVSHTKYLGVTISQNLSRNRWIAIIPGKLS